MGDVAAMRPTLPQGVRVRCEATIERLIAFLDAHDPEPDAENDDETGPVTKLAKMLAKDSDDSEPSLGAPNPTALTGCNWLRGACAGHDYEGDLADTADDREDDPSELEPSLGAPETTNVGQQTDCQAFTWSLPSAVLGIEDREHDPAECEFGGGADHHIA